MASSAIKVLLGQGHPSRPKKGLTIGVPCASGAVPPWLVDRTTMVQGYLAHENTSPRRTLQWGYAQGPFVVLGGGVFI